MFTLHDVIDIAIKIEQNGEQTYREASSKVEDSRLAGLLTWLADQEAEHALWFQKLGASGDKSPADGELASMGKSMLRDVVGEQSFSLEDVDLTSMETLAEVIEAAMELELDTAIFYQMLAGFVDEGPTREHLRGIIAEESRHASYFQEFLHSGELPTAEELRAQ